MFVLQGAQIGAQGKITVFGMLKRGDKVYTQFVKSCSVRELLPSIQSKADTDTIIYSDGFKTYDGFVNYGYKKALSSEAWRQ